MKVRDIMEPLHTWLTPEMTVLEAVETMRQSRRAHGLPPNAIIVLDSERKLVGIVSTTDILRLLIPSYMYLDGILEDDSSWASVRADRTERARSLHVRDIMTEDVRVINLHDSIMRCADIMLVEQLRRLPVVGTEGKVLGIVYLRDVYNSITEMLCNTSAEAAHY